jgi:hypothetical protein
MRPLSSIYKMGASDWDAFDVPPAARAESAEGATLSQVGGESVEADIEALLFANRKIRPPRKPSNQMTEWRDYDRPTAQRPAMTVKYLYEEIPGKTWIGAGFKPKRPGAPDIPEGWEQDFRYQWVVRPKYDPGTKIVNTEHLDEAHSGFNRVRYTDDKGRTWEDYIHITM